VAEWYRPQFETRQFAGTKHIAPRVREGRSPRTPRESNRFWAGSSRQKETPAPDRAGVSPTGSREDGERPTASALRSIARESARGCEMAHIAPDGRFATQHLRAARRPPDVLARGSAGAGDPTRQAR